MDKKSLYIITGVSKGLGKALLEGLLPEVEVKIIGISRSPVKEVTGFTHLPIDLSDTDALIKSLDKIFPLGPYKEVILVNNAGWIGEIAHNGRLNPHSIQKIHLVNVIAPAILMNAFMKKYKHMAGNKLVINISSGAASKVIDGWSGYCASKAALDQMTKIAQQESDRNDWGIKLYALSPGIIDTPMQEAIRSSSEEDFSSLSKFLDFKKNNELSTPQETAQKVFYLIKNHHEYNEVIQDVRNF